MTRFALFFITLFIFVADASAQTSAEEFSLTPNFHIFSVESLDESGICRLESDRSTYFNNYESQYGERLTKLTLRIAPLDGFDRFWVQILGQSRSKADAVMIQFNADFEIVEFLKARWVNTPKAQWIFVTEDASCRSSSRFLVRDLSVEVH